MQYGIYYAYWETEWGGNFVPYVEKCARLGFDVLEVACGAFDRENDAFFHELAAAARGNGMALTGGYGPRKEHDLATADNAQAEQTFRFYADMFRKMELAGIDRLGGALYSYWPAHGTPQTDKAADTARSARRMQRLADLASDHGITLGMEALNRFEGYLINTAQECIDYVRAVDRPNVKVMLDTFHMNIEEDSLTDAIRRSGKLLGHFHVGEANRRCPGPNGRFDWHAIGQALHDIGYTGAVPTAASTSTPTVTVFTPPAVEPDDPPTNISTSHTAFVTSRSAFWSKLAKPAVRSVTDWNRLASTFPPAVSPPIVPGLFHSSSAITAAPPSVSPSEMATTSRE